MSIRQCLSICCSPNTVSKFVRLFPKAALLFFILHIVILIITEKDGIKPKHMDFVTLIDD